jgi:hypothetical protein
VELVHDGRKMEEVGKYQSLSTATLGSSAPEAHGGEERRSGRDRRSRPTPMLSRYTFRGRRRGPRRADDPQWNYYVDRPDRQAWAMAVALFVLSACDALFTLFLLDRGAHEMNPFMRHILSYGHGPFLFVKYGLTFFGALMLLLHANYYLYRPWLSVRRIAGVLLFFYLWLVVYEVFLTL